MVGRAVETTARTEGRRAISHPERDLSASSDAPQGDELVWSRAARNMASIRLDAATEATVASIEYQFPDLSSRRKQGEKKDGTSGRRSGG
jgi:hypothetical protein